MEIIDVFSYNGESDMLRLHIEMLNPYVDKFIIVEAPTTFSGLPKPLYFVKDKKHVRKFLRKIKHFVVDENDEALWELARNSPNTKGAEHWKREFVQKESIKKALRFTKDDDIVYIGDVDEVWDASYRLDMALEKLSLRVYAYYLDNRSSEPFWGTLAGRWGFMRNRCLNHLRSDIGYRGSQYAGWHFTSMGGLGNVRRKLNDSYTTESYNTSDVQQNLRENVREGKDYLGRSFTFKTDESEWPEYLKSHRAVYAHLCREVGGEIVHKRGGYV